MKRKLNKYLVIAYHGGDTYWFRVPAASAAQAEAKVARARPGYILVDVMMPQQLAEVANEMRQQTMDEMSEGWKATSKWKT